MPQQCSSGKFRGKWRHQLHMFGTLMVLSCIHSIRLPVTVQNPVDVFAMGEFGIWIAARIFLGYACDQSHVSPRDINREGFNLLCYSGLGYSINLNESSSQPRTHDITCTRLIRFQALCRDKFVVQCCPHRFL